MSEQNSASDLFDLKMLPAWVKESPKENRYADFAGEEGIGPRERERDRNRHGGEGRERGPRPPRRDGPRRESRGSRDRRPPQRGPERPQRREEISAPLPKIDVRFLPDVRVLDNVLTQIKGSHVAYSVFFLARMFLEKPERYNVRLRAEAAVLFQIGENGPVASDKKFLENAAFPDEKENFYRIEMIQAEPVKGNFTSVARDRVSGTLLGPTNHHAYQPKLRALYEQRFSRRMSFPEYQRQIDIVSDPEVVERWKEEARSLTTYTTLKEEPPVTFNSTAEAERHFRQNYMAGLLRENAELTLDGVVSRRLADRALGRLIEDAWAQEVRSPSKMMQELIGAFPASGLHLFRHHKAMLFVASVRPRPMRIDSATISPAIGAILRAVAEAPGVSRKQLSEKMLPPDGSEGAEEDHEKKKLALASDLRWLISEGHIIEFNDGTLDLARVKPAAPSLAKTAAPAPKAAKPILPNESMQPDAAAAPDEPAEQVPPSVVTGDADPGREAASVSDQPGSTPPAKTPDAPSSAT